MNSWSKYIYIFGLYDQVSCFYSSVRLEVGQNTRRIVHHPSIAVIATNNENEMAIAGHWWPIETQFADEYRKLYVDTVRDELFNVTSGDNIEILVSSPSNGLLSERDHFLSSKPNDNRYGDSKYFLL